MSAITYKCPNCDGGLVFDPESGQYVCEFCLSKFTREELTEDESGKAVEYRCPSCGAEIITDETTAASFCFYCHNPIVLAGRLSGEYLPDGVLPFKITKDEAVGRFKSWIEKKKFVPGGFYSPRQIEKMSGIYFPYWIYECEAQCSMSGDARDIRVWRIGDTEYTETKKFAIRRDGKVSFKHLPKTALRKAENAMLKGIFPYNFEALETFHMGYLSGFQAEKRDIEKAALAEEVHQEIRDYAEKRMRDTIQGHNSFSVQSKSCDIGKECFRYTLLPVWVLTYRQHKNRLCYFAMNGQTGEICGKLPVDGKKLGLLGFLIFSVVLALFLTGGWLL